MEKYCFSCGRKFSLEKNTRRIYCSKACSDLYRHKKIITAREARLENDKEEIINLYHSDLSVNEIERKLHHSKGFIYKTWKEAGLEAKQRLTGLQRTVKALREQGLCCTEIADILGKMPSNIIAISKRIGMPFSEEEKQRSREIGYKKAHLTEYGDEQERDDRRRQRVAELHPGWTWVSGSIGTSDMVKIRCDCCQNIIERSAITIRHRSEIVCPSCAEAERQRQQKKKEEERFKEEREREERFWSQDFTQSALSFRICPECGAPHLDARRKYCSEECTRKVMNRKGDRRIRHMRKVDKSISLKKLYLRDGGKCWICGDKCDFNDCRHDENGNFIVGSMYPSIDHVYPISKGGAHSWDNVKLAHHYCNTLKNDKVVV